MKHKSCFSWRNVGISFLIFIVMYYLINFSPYGLARLHELTDGQSILDMEMGGYSVQEAYEILDALGDEGRNFEIKYIVPLDFPFPLSYGVFYFLLLSVLAKSFFSKMKRPWLIGLLGLCTTLFDWLENIMVIQLLNRYPERLEGVAKAANIFTQLKSSFTQVCMLLIIMGLIIGVMKKFIPKSKEKKSATNI